MMSKLFTVAIAAALATACQSSHQHDRDQSADKADKADKPASTHALVEGEVQHAEHAEATLDTQRELHAARLESRLTMLQLQEPVLRALADVLPLTDTGRADVDGKLDALASKVDQAQLALDGLEAGSGTDFAAVDQAARSAIQDADGARETAWKALGAARVPVQPAATGSATGSATATRPAT